MFTQNDEPSIVTLGIPIDTEASLLHPDTQDIIHKLIFDTDSKYSNTALYSVLKLKTDEERQKTIEMTRMVPYRLIKIAGKRIENANLEPLSPISPNSADQQWDISKWNIKTNDPEKLPTHIVSLKTQYEKLSMKFRTNKLGDEIKDLKGYLFTQNAKTPSMLIADLLKYDINTITALMNPKSKESALNKDEFNELKTVRMFFISKLKKFVKGWDNKLMANIMSTTFWILINQRTDKWTHSNFTLLSVLIDKLNEKKLSDDRIKKLDDFLGKENIKHSTPDSVLNEIIYSFFN